jgi:3-deoxy-manno-octulosonate cytidylyltransferase (CMP-KDO synthetase)
MDAVIVIPARYGSTRLPGKPLLKATGKYLIQHVYEQACQAKRAREVIVATDDPRVQAAVQSFGGRVAMTRRDHRSGTDRVAEVARGIPADVFINLQGDEPLIDPALIDRLPELLESASETDVATLAAPISSIEQWNNPNCVKVVCDARGRALYFSRSAIPYVRDGLPDFSSAPPRFLQHVGVYAYRQSFLLRLAASPPHPLEETEKLEQLRVLSMGRHIQVGLVGHPGRGVDTYKDYEEFLKTYRQTREASAA